MDSMFAVLRGIYARVAVEPRCFERQTTPQLTGIKWNETF
jgi:hypothetical protein